MTAAPYHLLFLCTGNSARSIMAEAIANHKGRPRFIAHSAGSHPFGSVRPEAIDQLQSANIPVDGLRSKSWDEFSSPGAPQLDFIFTVCDNAASEACPFWPGHPVTAHLGIPDPAAIHGTPAEIAAAYRHAFDLLDSKITAFLALPIDRLDNSSLKRELAKLAAC